MAVILGTFAQIALTGQPLIMFQRILSQLMESYAMNAKVKRTMVTAAKFIKNYDENLSFFIPKAGIRILVDTHQSLK